MGFEFSIEERNFLKALIENEVRFIIVGLTSAVLQESHVVTQDVDLWIEGLGGQKFMNAIKQCNAFYVPPGLVGLNPPMLGPNSLNIFDLVTHMHGLDKFEEEYKGALEYSVSGIQVKILPLERIILSKETANREKDRASLPALRSTLAMKKSKK